MRYSIIFFAVSLLFLFSCRKTEQQASDLHLVSGDKHLTKLTAATQQFGIKELIQTFLDKEEVTYQFAGATLYGTITYKLLGNKGMELTLQQEGEEEVTLLCNKLNKTMLYVEKGLDVLSEERGALSLEEQTTLALALTLYRELTSLELERTFMPENISSTQRSLDDGTCNYTAMSIRYTKSSSVDHLNEFVNDYLGDHPNCRRLHGVDSGCLWGDYGCISTQEITCNC